MLLLLGAATSFGVGIGTACAMPVVAMLLLPPSRVRSRRTALDVYIENNPFASVGAVFAESSAEFPGWAGLFAIYYPSNIVAGRRIRFVEKDAEVVRMAQSGRRTAGLLVSPDSAPDDVYRP